MDSIDDDIEQTVDVRLVCTYVFPNKSHMVAFPMPVPMQQIIISWKKLTENFKRWDITFQSQSLTVQNVPVSMIDWLYSINKSTKRAIDPWYYQTLVVVSVFFLSLPNTHFLLVRIIWLHFEWIKSEKFNYDLFGRPDVFYTHYYLSSVERWASGVRRQAYKIKSIDPFQNWIVYIILCITKIGGFRHLAATFMITNDVRPFDFDIMNKIEIGGIAVPFILT